MLLQAVQLAQPQRHLFSLEKARESHTLPDDVELAIAAAPTLPEKFKATVVTYSFQEVDVYGARGMRQIDYESLLKVKPLIDEMLSRTSSSRANFIAEEGNENAQKLVDLVTSLEPIAEMARSPWKPLMWTQAAFLRSFDKTVAVLGAPRSSRPAELPSDELIGRLGEPNDKDVELARQSLQALKIHFYFFNAPPPEKKTSKLLPGLELGFATPGAEFSRFFCGG